MRPITTALLVLAVTSPANGQTEEGLKKLQEKYKRTATVARATFKKDIQTLEAGIRQSGDSAATKTRKINQLHDEEKAFLENDKLPTSDLLLPATVKYLNTLYSVRRPLSAAYQTAIDRALKAKDDDEANRLTSEKATLDKQAGGLGKFAQGSKWSGTRQFAKDTVECELTVWKMERGSFVGGVWMGTGQAAVGMAVEGEADGNAITFHVTKMLRGDKRNLVFTGFVFDKRIVAEVTGTDPNGKPVSPSFVSLGTN